MILFILAFLMVCGLLSYLSVADPWKGISSPSAQATGEGPGEAVWPSPGNSSRSGIGQGNQAERGAECSEPPLPEQGREGRERVSCSESARVLWGWPEPVLCSEAEGSLSAHHVTFVTPTTCVWKGRAESW